MEKEIKGFEGLYTIDEDGNVYSIRSKIYLKPRKRGDYFYVGLHKSGSTTNKDIHRLVAEAFLNNPNNLPCVNHKDENKTNNNVNNLEWCSYEYNNGYGTKPQRLSSVLEGREVPWKERPVSQYTLSGQFVATYKSLIDAENHTGIKYRSIQQVASQQPYRKSAGGYIWRYANE